MTQAGAANVAAPGGTAMEAEPGVCTDEAARRALEALRLDWGEFYAIGRDGDADWWAARKGTAWAIVTAHGPDELRAAMAEDYGPVTW